MGNRFFHKSRTHNPSAHDNGTVTDFCETDNESCSSRKSKSRRSFLGFRRRSTSDLTNQSEDKHRGWRSSKKGRFNRLDSRSAMSDDEGFHIKVYQIDAPSNMGSWKSSGSIRSPNFKRKSKSNESLMMKTSTPAMIENHRKR